MAGPILDRDIADGPAAKVRNLALSIVRATWTLVPAVVTSVNHVNVTVNVKVKAEDIVLPFNELTDVPVVFPRGGSSIILMPISVDDVVMVAFSKFPLDTLLTNTQVVRKDLDVDDFFDVGHAVVLGGFILENEKGDTILDDAKYEIPTNDIILHAANAVKLGSILKFLNLTAAPSSPENGMMWRNGTAIWAHSDGVSSKWAGGGGTGSLPTFDQATEPTIGTNSQVIWRNSTTGKIYMVVRITAATQYKVELG